MVKGKTIKKSKTRTKTTSSRKTIKNTKGTSTPKKESLPKTTEGFHDLTIINEKLSQLENQALKAYECVQAIRKRSTPDWKEWINKLSPQDWFALANAQRERISLEIRHLSDEILSKIHRADILSDKNGLLQEAKYNLEDLVNKIDDSDLVDKAIDTAIHTKDGLLAFLNIPTHEEMIQLQRKLNRLERRMTQLAGRAH